MTQRFSLYDDLSVRREPRVHGRDLLGPGGAAAPARRRAARAVPPERSGRSARRHDERRPAPAPGAGRRHPARAGAAVPRRADQRRRSAESTRLLGEPVRSSSTAAPRFWCRRTTWTRRSAATRWRFSTAASLVADGAPRRLMAEIDAHGGRDRGAGRARRARWCSTALPRVRSVAQLGTRLHALARSRVGGRGGRGRARRCAGRDDARRYARSSASLEDVFVAATRKNPAADDRDEVAAARFVSIARKELRQLRRDRLTFGMIVGIPLLQILLFGLRDQHRRAPPARRRRRPGRRRSARARWWPTPQAIAGRRHRRAGSRASSSSRTCCGAARSSVGILIPRDFERRLQDPRRAPAQLLVDGSDPVVLGAARGLADAARGAARRAAAAAPRRGGTFEVRPTTTRSGVPRCRSCPA